MSGDSADPTRHPRRPEHDSLSDREIHAEATGHAAALAPLPPLLASVVPHGPHSVPRSLLRRIAERACARGDIISVHAAESAAEVEFVRRGTGPFRELLEQIEPLAPGWRPPGLSPIEVLDEAGLLGPRTLAVHCVHVTREDARILAARGATVVLCPRSNAAIGAGAAPVGMLASEGLRLALGTDSLASNDDLDIVSEMAALRALAPALASEAIVRAATLGGAEALGLASRFGSIEAGKRAALVYLRRRDGIAVGSDPFETIFAVPRTVTVTPVR